MTEGSGAQAAGNRSIEDVVEIVDDYGVSRTLVDFGEAGFEGRHDTGAGLEPYWLPRSYVWFCHDRQLIASLPHATLPEAADVPF